MPLPFQKYFKEIDERYKTNYEFFIKSMGYDGFDNLEKFTGVRIGMMNSIMFLCKFEDFIDSIHDEYWPDIPFIKLNKEQKKRHIDFESYDPDCTRDHPDKKSEERTFISTFLSGDKTGISTNIFIAYHGAGIFKSYGCDNVLYAPRIKVCKKDDNNCSRFTDNFSVYISGYPEVISDNPYVDSCSPEGIVDEKELQKIYNWIILNKNLLIDYWNEEIEDTEYVIAKLKKV